MGIMAATSMLELVPCFSVEYGTYIQMRMLAHSSRLPYLCSAFENKTGTLPA